MQLCQQGLTLDYEESQYICEYIENRTKEYGDKIAQVDEETGCTITYNQIQKYSDKLCLALQNHWDPVSYSDVIAIISANCIQYVWILLGVFKAKACSVLVNPSYTPREIQYNLSVSQPKLVICSYALAMSEHVLGTCPAEVFIKNSHIQEVWVWGCPNDTVLPPKFRLLTAAINLGPLTCTTPQFSPRQLPPPRDVTALILSSSGSTGLPKGVMLSNMAVVAALNTGHIYAKTDEIALGLMPFFHAYGLLLMLMCLCEGACIVVMKKFTTEHFLEAVQTYKVNNLYLVPSLLAFLSKHEILNSSDLQSVHSIWTGAGPVSVKLQEIMQKRFHGQATLYHSYGLTETTFTMFTTDYHSDKAGSPGKLTPGMDCKVMIDGTEEPQGPLVKGELCFRGPLLMQGYKGNQEATEKMIDENGWLHSGDLGYYDEDGFFYIVDRLKELIKYQGNQVSPSELESILITHKAVKDVAVIGIAHDVYGELPQALVVKQPGTDVSALEIQEFLAAEVAPHKRLHGGVRFVEEIPKTGNGKILRRLLKDMYNM